MAIDFSREARAKYIGGSELHHIVDEPPWGCRRRLWYEKKLYPYDDEPEVTAAMQRGTDLEPLIRQMFAAKFDYILGDDLPVIDDLPEWAGGNVDAVIMPGKGNKRGPGVAEFKAPGSWAYSMMVGQGLSLGYILQGQFYIWTRGVEWCHWGILPIETWELDCPILERSEPVIQLIKEECGKFWELLKGKDAPEPPLDTLAGHCNNCPFTVTCKGEAGAAGVRRVKKAMGKAGPGYLVVRDDALSGLVDRRQKFADIKKQAGEEVDGLKPQIIDSMREHNVSGAILENWKCKYSHNYRSVFQESTFKKKHPDLYKEFCEDREWDEIRIYALSEKDEELFKKGDRP